MADDILPDPPKQRSLLRKAPKRRFITGGRYYGSFYGYIPTERESCYMHPAAPAPHCEHCALVSHKPRLLIAGISCRQGTLWACMGPYENRARILEHGIVMWNDGGEARDTPDREHCLDHTVGLLQMLYLRRPFAEPGYKQGERVGYWIDPEIFLRHNALAHFLMLVMRETKNCNFEEELRIAGPRHIKRILAQCDMETGREVLNRMLPNLTLIVGFNGDVLRHVLDTQPTIELPPVEAWGYTWWGDYQYRLERTL